MVWGGSALQPTRVIMEDEVCVTFLRHRRSPVDDEKVHEGEYDSPLTDTGRAQVQHCAQEFLLRKIRFDRIISSTLLRAHETAKIIGQLLNVSIESDADWMELDNGPLAGNVCFIYIFTLSF